MIRLSWIIICDVAPLVAPVQEGLQLLRSPEATVDADLRTAVHEAAERLVHHNFVDGHGRERRRDAFDEVDAVLLGPALNNLAVSGASCCTGNWRAQWLRTESIVTLVFRSSAG